MEFSVKNISPFFKKLKQKPREYQIEALLKALNNRRSVIVLPTGTGKTLIGLLWTKILLDRKLAKKVLILEPTRILVEQVANYYKHIGRLNAVPIHGLLSQRVKREEWKNKIIVTTPEEALYHLDKIKDTDAIVIDECHHSIGEDAFRKVLDELPAEWRLGLSAHIPKRYRREINQVIGEIFEWSASNNKIAPYIPEWIGEIYEAPLDKEAMELYREFEARSMLSGAKERMLYSLAMRFLARDGALALKESVNKKTKLSELLAPYKEQIMNLPDLHKLKKAYSVFDQHDFDKAIIFVDRVVVAKRLYQEFAEFNPVLIIGRRSSTRLEELKKSLERAKSEDTRLIISTSAGEEGLDLPSADLLIIWSNVVSPLRFIQRHGRILRKTKPLKYAVYIVTPDTVDMNAFLDSIEYARKVGVDVPVDQKLLHSLRKKSPRRFLVEILEKPLPIEWIAELTGMTKSEAEKAISMFLEEGELFYIYTNLGRTIVKREHIFILQHEYADYFKPNRDVDAKIKVITSSGDKKTIYGMYEDVAKKLEEILKNEKIKKLTFIIKEIRNFVEFIYTLNYNFSIDDREILSLVIKNALTPDVYRTYG